MRAIITALILLVIASTALAQDAAQQAMQMAQQANEQVMQAAQQANQQAMQAAEQANQQAMQFTQQANQQAMDASQSSYWGSVAKPSFSYKSGTYGSMSITVRIKDRTRRTAIFYTTDGWTPTMRSTRYIEPITISKTTKLQAIAVGPNFERSGVAAAIYSLPNARPSETKLVLSHVNAPVPLSDASISILLKRGTPIPLVFTTAVDSKGKEIGDRLPVVLAQNLVIDGVLLADKSEPVLATVMVADPPASSGRPGMLSFTVRSISIAGKTVPLSGFEALEGQPRTKAYNSVAWIPWVGIGGALIHGHDAEIPRGAVLTAYVQRDTMIAPQR